jgi:hypothetical protein
VRQAPDEIAHRRAREPQGVAPGQGRKDQKPAHRRPFLQGHFNVALGSVVGVFVAMVALAVVANGQPRRGELRGSSRVVERNAFLEDDLA